MTAPGKHTPGPWSVHDVRQDFCDEIWIEAEHPELGTVSHASVRYGCDEAQELGDIEANAHLIAAAPDLLEALTQIAALDQHSGASLRDRAASEIARKAILKATGDAK